MHPNFLGIGAARSGTTWIARNLEQHPDIFLPSKKELHFFDRHYDDGIASYEQEFAGWTGQKAVGEITPAYLHTEEVAARIHAHLPAARLIVCLRNPIDRAYSSYWKQKASFPENTKGSFEEQLAVRPDMIQVGFYYDHLMRYLRLFRREQMHIVLNDDIEGQPDEVLRGLYRFLEVDDTFKPPTTKHRINAAASQGNMAKSKLGWLLYRGLSRAGAHGLANRLERLNSQEVPAMRPETKAHLRQVYREQTLLLQEFLQRDLSGWGLYDR